MPPSASGALSAALAGVSPFATRRSRRRDSPPPSGVDSCYGVRSLDGSVSWSEPGGGSASGSEQHSSEPSDDDNDNATAAAKDATASSADRAPSTSAHHHKGRAIGHQGQQDMDEAAAAFAAEAEAEAERTRVVAEAIDASVMSDRSGKKEGNNRSSDSNAETHTLCAVAADPDNASSLILPTTTTSVNASALGAPPTPSATTCSSTQEADEAQDARIHSQVAAMTSHLDASHSVSSLPPQQHKDSASTILPTVPATTAAAEPPAVPATLDGAASASTAAPVTPTVTAATVADRPPLISPASHALFDMLADAPSEPSSPASLASFPSMVASTSSLSRMSSPAEWDWRHPLSRSLGALDQDLFSDHAHQDEDREHDHLGSAELVLPTLALPNTSLHLGLDRHAGPGQGTRVAILADPEHTRDVLGVLASRRPCVQLPHGEVGIIGAAGLEATIVTGLNPDDIRRRVHDTYTQLHSLLNPSTTQEQQTELSAMVATYATTKDWIHLTVDLEGNEDAMDILDLVVPCTTLEIEAQRLADAAVSASTSPASISPTSSMSLHGRTPTSGHSGASTPVSDRGIDDTPRPVPDTLASWPSPFVAGEDAPQHQDAHESMYSEHEHEEHDDSVLDAVALLERVLDEPSRVRNASTSAFFNWRPLPLPNIPSPLLSNPYTSPASSTFEGSGPMPTVARAQGGGEWEATLSRRLAHRRELDASAASQRLMRGSTGGQASSQRARGRGGRRRRSHSPPAKGGVCPTPLFPRASLPAAASIGLVDLFDGMFSGVRRITRSRWGSVFFACAIAVAVGCGFWAVRARG